MRAARRALASAVTREQRIHARLEAALKPVQALRVEDLGGGCDGGTLRVTVVAECFAGKSVVAQHRMVNAALGDEMKGFHAAVLITSAPKKLH